jgi:Ni,Fe-hydrogenase III small subunit/formate hydrogenlyase subunit 6/NADH:ubiquinone oxidoreductase subunit I
MPIDIARRLLTPFRDPVPTSRYPKEPPLVAPALRGLPRVDATACGEAIGGCGSACVGACPTAALELDSANGLPSLDAGRCIFCAACAIACPAGAIAMSSDVELASADRSGLVVRAGSGAASSAGSAPGSAAAYAPSAGSDPSVAAREQAVRRRVAGRLGRSLHVRHLDAGSCNGCDWEIAALLNPYHDLQRLGIDVVASPRHADLLLVTGAMTANLEEAALRTFEAMPEPRLVVATGACAISGGVFAGSPSCRGGAGAVLPVDVWIPGCPPRPEALIDGLLAALELRRAESRGSEAPRPESPRPESQGPESPRPELRDPAQPGSLD